VKRFRRYSPERIERRRRVYALLAEARGTLSLGEAYELVDEHFSVPPKETPPVQPVAEDTLQACLSLLREERRSDRSPPTLHGLASALMNAGWSYSNAQIEASLVLKRAAT